MVNKTLFPFKGNHIKVNGLRYHYVDEGEGDTILMLHGNPTWSFYYRNLIQTLRFSHRTIAPDHIGCGYSEKPTSRNYPFTLTRRVEDLEALVDHLGLKDLTLVLHDWGGMIGMAFAVRHPHLIKRLIITNTAAFPMPTTKKRLPWQLKIARDSLVGKYLILNCNAFSRAASHVCVTRRPLPKQIRSAYLAPYGTRSNRLAVYRFVKDIPLVKDDPSYELVAETERNLSLFQDIPKLICWGAKDFVFDDHFLDRWREIYPGAPVHRFADAGHYVLEDAWEDIVPLIHRFLTDHPIA